MDATLKTPKTLQEAIVYFSDPARTFEYAKHYRWPSGEVTCPRCGKAKHSFIKTRRIWFCYECKKQFTLKVGTIMEDSPITLDKWMTAFWMLANARTESAATNSGKLLVCIRNRHGSCCNGSDWLMQDSFLALSSEAAEPRS
jgi:transposase-like protein